MERKEPMRELFIEELAEVRGGETGPDIVEKLSTWIGLNENLEIYSTMACGEEGPC